jgi:hypothetical protein
MVIPKKSSPWKSAKIFNESRMVTMTAGMVAGFGALAVDACHSKIAVLQCGFVVRGNLQRTVFHDLGELGGGFQVFAIDVADQRVAALEGEERGDQHVGEPFSAIGIFVQRM